MASNNETFSQESYNHGGMITFLLAMGVSILFFICLLIFHPGIDLKEVGSPDAKKSEPTAQGGTAAPNAAAAAPAPAEPEKK